MWEAKRVAPGIVHVVPVDDIIDHNLDSADCVCGPRVRQREQGTVIVHASLDGRELVHG